MTALATPRDRATGQSPQSWSGIASLERVSLRLESLLPCATSGGNGRDKVRHRSVPEILESLGVASLRLAAADADHVKTFRAGLERADDRRSDAQHVPR
jgi:hypothetical protein